MATITMQEADARRCASLIARARHGVLATIHYLLAEIQVSPGETITIARESFASWGLDLELVCVLQPLQRKDAAALVVEKAVPTNETTATMDAEKANEMNAGKTNGRAPETPNSRRSVAPVKRSGRARSARPSAHAVTPSPAAKAPPALPSVEQLAEAALDAVREVGYPLGLLAVEAALRERGMRCAVADLRTAVDKLEDDGRLVFRNDGEGKGYVPAEKVRAEVLG